MDKCTIEDARAGFNITEYWPVDSRTGKAIFGFAEASEAQTDGEADEWRCNNCGDFFNSWPEVKNHLRD